MVLKKEMVWAFYAILMVILGVVGYFVGKSKGRSELYASIGVVVGALISLAMWFGWAKNNVQ